MGEAAFLPHKRDGALNATADVVAARLTETVITVLCQETPSAVAIGSIPDSYWNLTAAFWKAGVGGWGWGRGAGNSEGH